MFSADERSVHRLLREALPQHIVLAKLPLVRFCQPIEQEKRRFWYELLGQIHVGFAVCSAEGDLLLAVDLEADRNTSRRALRIKRSVLEACQVRYLRCPIEALPAAVELQQMVPGSATASRHGATEPRAADLGVARDALASTVALRRAERTTRWQDSAQFQDSFFITDGQVDESDENHFVSVAPADAPCVFAYRSATGASDDLGGVVFDVPDTTVEVDQTVPDALGPPPPG